MQSWRSVFLGLRELPEEISDFELQAFFTFTKAEQEAITQRRRPLHSLGLALHIGFLRMCGRALNAFRIIPASLWRHLGTQCGVDPPDVSSIRGLYKRRSTLYEHQQLACNLLGFIGIREHQRRQFARVLRDEVGRTADRDQLLAFARGWLYDHHFPILHTRVLRRMSTAAIVQFETELGQKIKRAVPAGTLGAWRSAIARTHESGGLVQNWLWASAVRHSSREISQMVERIRFLYSLEVERYLTDLPDELVRRYSNQLSSRAPGAGPLIQEPGRTIEVACFLRYCLLNATDQLVLMVRRREASNHVTQTVNRIDPYQQLIGEVKRVISDTNVPDHAIRGELTEIVTAHEKRKRPSHAQLVRERLVEAIGPMRALLAGIIDLPWESSGKIPVIEAIKELREPSSRKDRRLPRDVSIDMGKVWRNYLGGDDRDRAYRALEVASLLELRRALRNGSVSISHSFTFLDRQRLFIPTERWTTERSRHYSRLGLPRLAKSALAGIMDRVRTGLTGVAGAIQNGQLRIDENLHVHALEAAEQDPAVKPLRSAFEDQIGSIQLPELILTVDSQVRFSWLMLGREPRSTDELLMVYAGILGHGTALSAAEIARMIPPLSADSVRQAMRWAGEEQRLARASAAVLLFMHEHPIAAAWGRADLASSDMMSLETARRVWQARLDPRRRTPSIGIYSHVRDRWGIFYAQPIVLNERQVGAAIEGVIRQKQIDTTQLAVDTHGYSNFGMCLAWLLGFDLCPRLSELKQRRFYVPRGFTVPQEMVAVCKATVNLKDIEARWENLVHLAASVLSGHSSAIAALSRFGSSARGDPVYEAGVQLGQLLRTVFLCDYFVKDPFRRELLQVLNRGESVNSLKRAIYVGRVSSYQARREEEMQSVANGLSLLANIVMAWKTSQMQAILNRWNAVLPKPVPQALIGPIAPTHIERINLRGVFQFPFERFAGQLLPSLARRSSKQSSF